MIDALLADRFGLRTHVEQRRMNVYLLTLARPDGQLGPRLSHSAAVCVDARVNGLALPPECRPRAFVPNTIRLNAQTRTLVLQDAIGAPIQFVLRDDTMIAGGQRTDDYFEQRSGAGPWANGQRLSVTWRASADRQKRVAIAVQ